MLRNLLINWFQMALFADPFANALASPYSLVAFRLGMIVFRKTVCSSSTNGTRYT
jgi:hypothetical protein